MTGESFVVRYNVADSISKILIACQISKARSSGRKKKRIVIVPGLLRLRGYVRVTNSFGKRDTSKRLAIKLAFRLHKRGITAVKQPPY